MQYHYGATKLPQNYHETTPSQPLTPTQYLPPSQPVFHSLTHSFLIHRVATRPLSLWRTTLSAGLTDRDVLYDKWRSVTSDVIAEHTQLKKLTVELAGFKQPPKLWQPRPLTPPSGTNNYGNAKANKAKHKKAKKAKSVAKKANGGAGAGAGGWRNKRVDSSHQKNAPRSSSSYNGNNPRYSTQIRCAFIGGGG